MPAPGIRPAIFVSYPREASNSRAADQSGQRRSARLPQAAYLTCGKEAFSMLIISRLDRWYRPEDEYEDKEEDDILHKGKPPRRSSSSTSHLRDENASGVDT
ncbi:unnamed protein product [Pleuronectes platessa]|uniref:Uncharacterized protein n=1 Tax=Pleuronectes platessa TaxID=8262 RepID=A0A9N7U3H8_PLEPL|nr:unnamed protein product [Pleuronectes platessa]